MRKRILAAAVLVLLACMLAGCASSEGLLNWLGGQRAELLNSGSEAESFNRLVDDFFATLDAKDAEGIRELFAPAVLEARPDMDAQIEALFEAYPGTTNLNLRDGGMASGGSSSNYGRKTAWGSQRFPVVSGGNSYVCRVEVMYENDEDESQIGIQSVILMNLDTEYAIRHDMDGFANYPEEPGLHVMTDYDSGLELRFVEGRAEQVNSMDRTISEEEIRAFCAEEENRTYPALREAFGEPNGEADHVSYRVLIYELQSVNGEPRYFRVYADAKDEKLSEASITGEFDWISRVFE